MWPYPDGRPLDFEDENGMVWHRGSDGSWHFCDDVVGWQPIRVNKMSNRIVLHLVKLEPEGMIEDHRP